jgi:two-component system NtrC family sensor kinase
VGKGTGLGLSICYGIVTRMGGEIDARSEIGSGTEFRIRLPIKREEAEGDESQA